MSGDGRRSRRQDQGDDAKTPICLPRLGQRLPADHLVDPRDQDARRPRGLQVPRAAGAVPDLCFKALNAAPSPINFNEVYTALQTKVVEGPENALAIIATARLYEVQKSCSLTGHVWDGYWVLANKRAFQSLPENILGRSSRPSSTSPGLDQRGMSRSSHHPEGRPAGQGSASSTSTRMPSAPAATTFYSEWKDKYGEGGGAFSSRCPVSSADAPAPWGPACRARRVPVCRTA